MSKNSKTFSGTEVRPLPPDRGRWDPTLASVVQSAALRTLSDLDLQAPSLAKEVVKWLGSHCDVARPHEYFTHPQSLPFLALPFWLETSFRGIADLDFQYDLIYASVNGYYFARMLDDVTDGHEVSPTVLPALGIFHMNLQRSFSHCFDWAHAFWDFFRSVWSASAEITSIDLKSHEISEADFMQHSGRKTIGGTLPIGAVCYRYDRCDLLPKWLGFFDKLARWNQMQDDFRDWGKDCSAGRTTWLLCEARRRKAADQSIAGWMGREGVDWATHQLHVWMNELVADAQLLESDQLVKYLHFRSTIFAEQTNTIKRSIEAWAACLESVAREAKA
jgi:hypothetical protein